MRGKMVTGVETAFSKLRRITDTLDRRKGDRTVSRRYPVHWIGTGTSLWEMDAGDMHDSERQRLHNFNVSSRQNEPTEDESKEWNQVA